MPLKKIKEIKNIDAFDSFEWQGDELKRFNLIYGWNGSGKTTLSRLFNFLERKSIHIPDLKSIEFSMQTDESIIRQNNFTNHALEIRVFNEDFVQENLLFEEAQAKKIVILGKENVEVRKEIDLLTAAYDEKTKKIADLEEQLNNLPKLDAILTEAGRRVPQQFANTPMANDSYYGRTYNKNKVEKQLENGTVTKANLDAFIISDQGEIDERKDLIKNGKSKITTAISSIPNFSGLFTNAKDLLNAEVHISEIERLKDDKVLLKWVEDGYKLHKERNLAICQFCENDFSEELMVRLGDFFTDELQKMKNQIEHIVSTLEHDKHTGSVVELQADSMFPDLVNKYVDAKKEFDIQIDLIKSTIDSLIAQLHDKKENLHDQSRKYSTVEYPKEAIASANGCIKKVTDLIAEHNKRVETISDEISKAAQAIELNIIATFLKDKDYFQNKEDKEHIVSKIETLVKERSQLDGKIQEKKAAIHNATDAVIKINGILSEYFGENHIYLEAITKRSEIQYALKRRNNFARHLSEGEESVLALAYFLIKLEEDGCNKENCLVVIDDPVDSQDGIFLFRTSALIKRQLNRVGQLVIFTHNFEFFNLIRDWFLSRQLLSDSCMYLISLDKLNTVHEIKIGNLPELLREYKSEYQYLFSRLYHFSKGTKPLDEPLVANIARKILEYFAGFKWSCRTTEEFTNIVLTRFVTDQNLLKKGIGDFVVKFLHEYSHGQNFSRGITASMLESKSIAENVLKFIYLADKEHYDDLVTLCA